MPTAPSTLLVNNLPRNAMTPSTSVGNVRVAVSVPPACVATGTLSKKWLSTVVPAAIVPPGRLAFESYVPGDVMSTRIGDASVTPCCSSHAHVVVSESRPVKRSTDAGGEILVTAPLEPEIAA